MYDVADVFPTLDKSVLATPSANTSSPASTSWLDTLGGFINSAGRLIQNGTEAVIGEAQRLNALNSTLDDTARTPVSAPPKVVTGMPTNWPSWALPAIIAGGVVVAIIVVRKLRN